MNPLLTSDTRCLTPGHLPEVDRRRRRPQAGRHATAPATGTPSIGRWRALALLALLAASAAAGATGLSPAVAAPDPDRIVFPASVSQGAMVIGKVPPGSTVRHAGRTLRVTGYGSVVFGVGRDAVTPLEVEVVRPDGRAETLAITITQRDWPIERVDGVPPKTVAPPPAIAERIRREQATVTAARAADAPRADFAQAFIWPVKGRISGRFGNQRVYNGTPGSAHSGMDIAAPSGTPVLAPAAGVVTLVAPDFYLTGGTLLLDHGHGISSNFLHLSRIDVQVGDRVEQGQPIAAVGATGRATGPHLHWGMNWFDVRIDPLLALER
jgi:murein DD-endopeptidase MepM/ murein hydrolase activator NlpD